MPTRALDFKRNNITQYAMKMVQWNDVHVSPVPVLAVLTTLSPRSLGGYDREHSANTWNTLTWRYDRHNPCVNTKTTSSHDF